MVGVRVGCPAAVEELVVGISSNCSCRRPVGQRLGNSDLSRAVQKDEVSGLGLPATGGPAVSQLPRGRSKEAPPDSGTRPALE